MTSNVYVFVPSSLSGVGKQEMADMIAKEFEEDVILCSYVG